MLHTNNRNAINKIQKKGGNKEKEIQRTGASFSFNRFSFCPISGHLSVVVYQFVVLTYRSVVVLYMGRAHADAL